MTLFAVTLSHAARAELRFVVQLAFMLYVLLSFVAVSTYTAKKLRTGRLIDVRRAPLPFLIPPAGEWLFVLNVLALLVTMQSVVELAAALAGLVILFEIDKRFGKGHDIMRQGAAWMFVLNVLNLLFMQSPLYMILVVTGLVVLLMESGRDAGEQFGLNRLTASQLVKLSLLICGAVIVIEAPLTQVLDVAMNTLHLPHPEQSSVETFRQFTRPSQIFDFMIQAVLISPLIEELFFRGFLLTFLKSYTSTWLALVLSAGVFAVAHVNLGSALPLWVLGIVLGVAYEHTGSILLPMGIHACFNLVTALSLLLDKGNPS